MIQLYLGIHCQKHGQYIGKPKRPKILPPTVAQLRNCTPTIWRTLSRMAPSVYAASPHVFFYLTQCCHGTDDKLCIRLGDLIQPKP